MCEQALYCSTNCLKKDKRFHAKSCIPVDKIEVISNQSNLVIELRKRDSKAEQKSEQKLDRIL